jgi:hypothetical protein
MALALVQDGVITQYPAGVGELRQRFPDASFPSNLENVDLGAFGAVVVQQTPQPAVDTSLEQLREGAPEQVDGVWRQTWVVTALSAEQLAAKAEQLASAVRDKRDKLLAETDYTQLADSPVDTLAWATYRQALRDMPIQTGFPSDVQWPTGPS